MKCRSSLRMRDVYAIILDRHKPQGGTRPSIHSSVRHAGHVAWTSEGVRVLLHADITTVPKATRGRPDEVFQDGCMGRRSRSPYFESDRNHNDVIAIHGKQARL